MLEAEEDPADALEFSLDAAPGGATIGTNNGVFTWTAPQASLPLTNSATVPWITRSCPAMCDSGPLCPKPLIEQ